MTGKVGFGFKVGFALVATLPLLRMPATAQDYPSGQVRIVVPAIAGGGLDIIVRPLAQRLSERWKQPVIIDNRPGAGGLIGAGAVAKAAPDGLMLLAAQDQIMVTNRYLYKSLTYDPDTSFVPIAMLVQANQMILASTSVPVDDLGQLVALVKQEKGKFSYGSYGAGSQPQLAFEMLNRREGLDIIHVPYKGVAPVITGLLGNEIQLSMGSAAVAGALISAGKLKALAIASAQRDPAFPDVKTTRELGYPYLRIAVWHSLYAPAGTPSSIVDKIAKDVRAVLKEPDFAKSVPGFELLDGGPQELAQRNQRGVAIAQEMVTTANIRPE
jgi:tripartite-type tricarboxylate transporter receptor subunit TctC